MEKYDFELMEKSEINPLGIIRNGWTIVMYKMTETGGYYNEYPPFPEFYKIQKSFYPNGMLKSKKKIPFGEEMYFDEQGNITKEISHESQEKKINYNWILEFLDKEGYINLKTGEGREYAIIEEDGKAYIIPCRFSVYITAGEQPYWVITIIPAPWNKSQETIYHIDANNGKLLFKESKQKFPIM